VLLFPTQPVLNTAQRDVGTSTCCRRARAGERADAALSGFLKRGKKGWPGMTQPRAPSPCRARAEWLETRGGLDHPEYDSATKPGNASLFASTCSRPVALLLQTHPPDGRNAGLNPTWRQQEKRWFEALVATTR